MPFRPKLRILSLLATSALPMTITAALAQESGALNLTVLDTLTITGSGENARTEGADSYQAGSATVSSRLPARLRETPRSISVVTRQRLDDEMVFTDLDAIARVPGMTVDGPAFFQSISSRGFNASNNMNGLRINSEASYNATALDAYLMDRIEVLRGPAGLLEGRGTPGGVVNRSLKRPLDSYTAQGSVTYGSYDFKRVELDASAPLNAAGTVRGRLAGAYQDRDYFYDISNQQRGAILGTVEADLSEDTLLRAFIVHQQDNLIPFWGLPSAPDGTLLDVPRSTFLGSRHARFETSFTTMGAELEHRFDNGWRARLAANHFDVRTFENSLYVRGPIDPADGIGTGEPYYNRDGESGYNIDASVSGDFEALGRTHQFVVGASYLASNMSFNESYGAVDTPFDIYNPDYSIPVSGVPFVNFFNQSRDYRQIGLYGQTNLSITDRLKISAGGRLSWADFNSVDRNNPARVLAGYDENAVFTPMLGAVFNLTPATTLYASFADVFQPQTARSETGDVLPPITGTQYEVGIKNEFLDGRLSANLALFHIVRQNEAIRVPGQSYSIAVGEARSRGFEVELAGHLTPQWKLHAGYAYTDHEILKAAVFQGNVAGNTPRHKASLWTSYRFEGDWMNGLEAGVGVTASSGFFDHSNVIRAPGYITVDAALRYAVNDSMELSVRATNIFDSKHYERLGGTISNNHYAAPRSVLVQLKGKI